MWRSLALDLHRAGVLTAWDAEMFAVFCDLAVQVSRAREHLRAGLVVRGRRDRLVTNPAWRIYRDGIVLLRWLAQEFGLTPSARSTLRVRGALDPALAEVVELARARGTATTAALEHGSQARTRRRPPDP